MFDNRIKNFALLVLAFFAFSLNSFAQSGATISGIVSNLEKPFPNTKVTLISATNQTTIAQTDSTGKYIFSNIPNGKYTITAELTNGVATSVKIEVVENRSLITDLTFGSQRPSNQPFGEVTIIASGTLQPIDQVTKSVSIISGKELENRQEISVVDSLRTIPGLRVQQLGGFGRFASLKTRGLRNQDTAVLIDGQRFRDASAITGDVGSFLSDLTVANIDKVEVLRGSGSSLYGTNAIGGVFNVITEEGNGKFKGNLSAEGGGLQFGRARLQVSEGLLDNKFKYSSGFSQTYFGKGIDGNDLARNLTANGKTSYEFNKHAKISFGIWGANSFVQLNSNADGIGILPATGIIKAVPLSRSELKRYETGTPRNQLNAGNATFIPDADDGDASQKSRFLNLSFGLSGLITNQSTYSVSYQNLTTNRKNFNGRAGVAFQASGSQKGEFDGKIETFRASSNIFLRSNTITFGYEFEREKFGNDNFQLNSTSFIANSTDATQTSNTLYVQNQLGAFGDRLQLSGAIRAQFFALQTPKFTGANPIYQNLTLENPPKSLTADGSAAYFFRETNTKIRAHIGNGYRVPSLYERFGSFFSSFSNAFVAFGDPNLKPEKTLAVDGGIEQSFSQNRAKFSATYFYTKLIKTIDFSNTVPAIGTTTRPFGGYFNSKGAIARGGELSAEIRLFADTNIFTSYTYTNSDQRAPQISGSGVLQTLGIPERQFTLTVNQQIAKRLNVNFDFVGTNSYLGSIFSNQTFATRVYRFAGNRKGDLGASYTLPFNSDKLSVKFFGKIENIFNQDYYENGFRTARIFGRGGLQFNF